MRFGGAAVVCTCEELQAYAYPCLVPAALLPCRSAAQTCPAAVPLHR